MVEIFVENAFLTAEVMFDGGAERLDEIDDGLLLDEDPSLSLLLAEGISGNLWHDVCETRVRWADVTVPGRWYLARGTTRCEQKSCCQG